MNSRISLAHRGAFTLVEILVVIGVIALLAGILFPVMGRVRETGRRTVCTSNLKQLGLAFQQYQQDSGGRYPLAGNYQGWKAGSAHWVAGPSASLVEISFAPPPLAQPDFKNAATPESGSLFSYSKSSAIYFCPSSTYGQKTNLSYGMNCAVSGLSNVRIRQPGDIVLLVDESYPTDGYLYAANTKGGTSSSAAGCNADPCSTDSLTTRHNGGGNLLFADGHIKFHSFESFPLDHSPQGLTNKSQQTGSPRFHDRAFGSKNGSSLVPLELPSGTFVTGLDACAEPTS